jgi:hypothetical protein
MSAATGADIDPREDAMIDLRHVEALLKDAIALLDDNGFPLAAESLRDNLQAIRRAPTAGAKRRRLFQLRDLFEGMGPAVDVSFCSSSEAPQGIRFARSASQRRDQERYRRTLEAIQTILSVGPSDDPLEAGWSPAMPRVA